MIRRILPHPALSLLIVIVWMGVVNRFAWGSLVFAAILGIAIPLFTARYWSERPMLRNPWKAASYTLLVVWDIVKANIDVARIVLFMPVADLRPAWAVVPLDLKSPEGITVLSATITLTPGTVTSDISENGNALLIHCLHAPDPDGIVTDIKTRYEARLKEIFR
ncbi:Na+/H+ antiporter subunit E [Paracoccus sp. Z118]|uniref:Na+/H+ antiporter subunit E n=1 Tax=Paracoccus sp. Z118 TaxID=2851017 RepID=UPI001C2C79A4|nr:Na+/H+ antiporter subunit E [Paracoccus sp. Z118]MBV0891332.1 Na+/H+ antiporter subunit E [Paracoccus sp. Z118]